MDEEFDMFNRDMGWYIGNLANIGLSKTAKLIQESQSLISCEWESEANAKKLQQENSDV